MCVPYLPSCCLLGGPLASLNAEALAEAPRQTRASAMELERQQEVHALELSTAMWLTGRFWHDSELLHSPLSARGARTS